MKKTLYILLMIISASTTIVSCTEEEVKPQYGHERDPLKSKS